MPRLRIGVVAPTPVRLQAHHLRTLDAILQSDWGELSLFIVEPAPRPRRPMSIAQHALVHLDGLAFAPPPLPDRARILRALAAIPTVADCGAAGEHRLDVLIDYRCGPRSPGLQRHAAHGLWTLEYGDPGESGYRGPGQPPGLREIVADQPFSQVTLRRTATDATASQVIDCAICTTAWSLTRNLHGLKATSVPLLIKHLRLLAHGIASTRPSAASLSPRAPARAPGAIPAYLARLAARLVMIAVARILRRAGGRPAMWLLFQADGDALAGPPVRPRPFPPPPGRFWADPFVFEHEGRTHVFFEEYSYRRRCGHIAVGRLDGGALVDVRPILVQDTHRSYPHVFSWRGGIFMIPESTAARRLEVWRATDFPTGWTLHATAFHGEALSDPTFHVGPDGQAWLFANMTDDPQGLRDTELRLFAIDGPDLAQIVPHRLNPIKLDARSARGAGPIFADDDGQSVRPAQIVAHGRYGAGITLSRITRLTLEDYADEPFGTISPDFHPGLVGTHHIAPYPGGFLLDGCRAWAR